MMLIDAYDAVLCDLDGVVYEGPHAIPGASQAVEQIVQSGRRTLYITNNASRTTEAVAQHLSDLAIPTKADDVVSSAQAAARVLATEHPAGSPILVVGGAGLEDALSDEGLVPVRSVDDSPAAVVQGFDPEVGWKQLAEATFAVRAGVPWIATNIDLTIPVERGIAPGNGTLVSVVEQATGVTPRVAGKPEPAIFETAVRRADAKNAIMVGDRLDTDIAGANRAGIDSLLVLTGITGLRELAEARGIDRPTHIADSISGLFDSMPAVRSDDDGFHCGAAHAVVVDGKLIREGAGAELARAVSSAVWAAVDAGTEVDLDGL
ncbi:HAD-IIA family hydrolase [Saxibacter everestensis]|uniref:HAD-IIA family hydrolase n=1 Tax=Saxibacter everestensis TaxID=2909229 RepID=A0ABY8QVX7_9MICO|nr:HAD-IIA family hydrolase [Brevibacteriaceae bacterium ZFBP1038]